MRALITGSNGFLGSALAARLLERGCHSLRCFVRPGSHTARLEALSAANPGCLEYFTGSLTSARDLERALREVDIVFHLAAGMRGAAADMCMNTVVTSRHLLDAATAAGVSRMVLVSSFAVYGADKLRRRAMLDESAPLEDHPEWRDPYALTKLRQEQLFHEYRRRCGFELVVLRPGVIYGPGGSPFSARVGIQLPGLFMHCGNRNILPLTYVDNCAEALVCAAEARHASDDEVYNVVDDDLPTSRQYLREYRRRVRPIRTLSLPYPATLALSHLCQWYHRHSRGQMPAILTPYKTAFQWKGFRFTNAKLKSIGWQPPVSTDEGLRRTFAYFQGIAAHAS